MAELLLMGRNILNVLGSVTVGVLVPEPETIGTAIK